MIKDGVDQTMVEGASTLPYQVPNLRVSAHIVEAGVSTLWWRSVGSTHTAYSTETFLDQLAEAAGIDPLAIRQKLLAKHPRHLAVLNLAAEKAGWGKPLPAGKARGHRGARVLQVVRRACRRGVDRRGRPAQGRAGRLRGRLRHRRSTPTSSRRSSKAAWAMAFRRPSYGAIDLEDGRIAQSNFHDYRVLRINEMPHDRGAHRAVDGEADRHRRAGRAADRAGGRQRVGEAHRPAHLRSALLAFRSQSVRSMDHESAHSSSGSSAPRQSSRSASRCRGPSRRRHTRLPSRCSRQRPSRASPTRRSARWRSSPRPARSSSIRAA